MEKVFYSYTNKMSFFSQSQTNYLYCRVLEGENILKNPLDGRQRISSTLDKICKCGLTVNHCSYSTFSHCSNGPEKEFHCVETSSEVQLSRKKREISLERTIDTSNFIEKENVVGLNICTKCM